MTPVPHEVWRAVRASSDQPIPAPRPSVDCDCPTCHEQRARDTNMADAEAMRRQG